MSSDSHKKDVGNDGNLPDDTRESDIRNLFERYGEVKSITMKNGFAFVKFNSIDSVKDAIEGADGQLFNNKNLAVNYTNSDGRDNGCFTCGSLNHWSKDCPRAIRKNGYDRDIKCNTCGSYGHHSSKCNRNRHHDMDRRNYSRSPSPGRYSDRGRDPYYSRDEYSIRDRKARPISPMRSSRHDYDRYRPPSPVDRRGYRDRSFDRYKPRSPPYPDKYRNEPKYDRDRRPRSPPRYSKPYDRDGPRDYPKRNYDGDYERRKESYSGDVDRYRRDKISQNDYPPRSNVSSKPGY